MKRPNYLEQVKKKIHDEKDGSVFIPSDFFNIAEATKINMCLNRLVANGELHRVMRGVYVKPRYSELLNMIVPPRANDIAKAIARNYGWTIIPCGDTALNILGLSTQVPAVWLYVSDGPYKTYEVDGITLQFKHTDSKNEVINISYKTALVVQALKSLGERNVTEKDIYKIARLLTKNEKALMIIEAKRVTAWVYGFIRVICQEEGYE